MQLGQDGLTKSPDGEAHDRMPAVRTAKKWLLGKEIQHMIRTADKNQTEAAKEIETTQSRIAGLITGVGAISVGDLERLANRLGFTDPAYQETLLELRRDNHKRGFWSSGHNLAYRDEMRLLVDLEQAADQIRSAQVEQMPGLLQCESYVRSMYADLPEQGGVTLEERVQARVARQVVFHKEDPPTIHFVLSESCLRRFWGDLPVMREQINHLVKLSDLPNVMIQVMPFNAPPGRRSPIGNRFTLIRVPSPGVAGPLELAYTEGEGETRYLDDKKALIAHDRSWARLSTAALSFEESRKFLRQVAREYRK
jgi:predicted XRE-type DNA-binding protein